MKSILKLFFIFIFSFATLFASQKQAENIAQISAVSLYNIDKNALQKTVKAYIKNYSNLKALKVVETLSNETYISIYKNENAELLEGNLPSDLNKYTLYQVDSLYENEVVGKVYAYFENQDLINLTQEERKWLDSNTITLSVDDKYAPMNFRNEENKMDGLSIDYIKLIEKKIGYPIKLDTNSWPIALDNAMKHKSDGIINANSTPKRDKKLIFTDPYIIVPMVLITTSSADNYSSLSQLDGKTILVKEKTVEASVLPEKYPGIKIKEVATYKEAFMLVSSGKAHGVFGHMAVLEYEKDKYLLPNIKKNLISFNDVITKQAIGIRNTAPLLKDIINKAIASISKEQKKTINDKWMKPLKKDTEILTKGEISWLKQNPAITIAVVNNYPPYDFTDENNELKGFHTDILNLINQNLGINAVLKPFDTWSKAYNAAANGSVNAIFSLSWSEEREEKYFDYTSPYHFSPYFLVTDKNNNDISSMQDLAGKNVSIEKDTIFNEVVKEMVPSAKIVYAKNTKEAYDLVNSGKTVATISPNINDELFKNSSLKVASEIYHKSSNIYIGINKNYPLVASILTKGIDSISLQDITNLRQKWFTKTKAIIELNAEEKQWIAKNPDVEVIKFFDEPPFTLNGSKKSGYVYELIEYLIESAGLNVKYVNGFKSYGEMLETIENGKADILTTFPTSLNLGPDSNIVKSKSILKTPFVLISTSNNRDINSIEELYGKKVAVVKGYVQDKYLSNFPQIKKVYVSNNEEGFEFIRLGKAEFYINNKANTDYVLNKSFATDLKINFELPYDGFPPLSISFAMNGEKKVLVSILNKALEQIPYKKIKSIRDKWILSSQKESSKIVFTPKEQEFLKTHPTIVLGADQNWQPFDFRDKFGKHAGFNSGYIELLRKKLGINIKVELGKWGELQDKVKNKKLAGLVGPTKTAQRDKYMEFTEPYFMVTQVILFKNTSKAISSLNELNNKTLAIKSGSSNIEYFKKNYPNIKLKVYETYGEIIRAVSLGEVDSGISNIGAASYEIEKNFISNIKVGYEIDELAGDMRFGIRKDWPELASILQKGIDVITREEVNKVLEKWLKLGVKPENSLKLEFSETEKQWLDKNPAIRIAYMDYWTEDDNGLNIHSEYVGLLSKYGNINVSLIRYDAWKKGFDAAQKGNDVFGILNLSWSKEREKNSFDYTKPYFFSPGFIIVKKGDNTIKSLEDLANKNILLKDNSITNQIVKDLKYNISTTNLKTEEDIHRALSQSENNSVALLTYVNDPDLLAKYDLKIANKFFTKYGEIHIGTSKKHKELYSIINKIYDVVPKSELSRIQNKSYKKTSKIKVELSNKEKEFIKSNGTIRVHNETNWPPFNYYEFGQPKGYSVELMKLVAKNTGLDIEFISGPTWDEFLQQMKKGELDVVINIVKNEQRDKYMLFTDPFIQATMGIAINKNNQDIQSFDDILTKNVALENGFFYHDYFKKNHPDTNLVVVDDGVQTLQSVSLEKANATIGFVPVMKFIAEKNFITGLKYFTDTSSPIMQPMPLRFSTRKDTPELLSILQKGLASITPAQLQELSKRWLGGSSEKKITVNLTTEERKWLSEHKEIRFTADPSYMPYESFDEQGNYIGMVADYLSVIEDTLNIKFTKIPTQSWTESLEKAKNTEIDVLSNYTVDKDLRDVHISSVPYISSPISIITKDDFGTGITLDDLKDKKIAVIKGYGYLNNIFVKYPNLNYVEVDTAKDGLTGVSLGDYDAIICSLTLAKYKIADLGLHNLIIAGQTGEIMRLGLGVRKDWKPFVDILNKVINDIPAGTRQEINKKWLGSNFEEAKKVNLTTKEQEWLDKEIPIKYVFDPDWAPFEWKNELNEHTGIIYDLLTLVSERTSMTFEPVPTNTWQEAVELAENKKVDMYGGLGENEERKKYMKFTKNSLYATPYVFVVKNDNNRDYFDTFNSLKGDEKIAVVEGYTIHGIMKDKKPEVKLSTVSATMDGFKKVSSGELDIFIVNAATARYYINRNGFENLKIAAKTDFKLEIKSAIRNDWPPEVLSILDKGLESISDKELAEIYRRWTEVTVEEKMDWTLIYQIGFGSLAVLLFIAYWNRKLKKTVDSKTAELQKLLSSFDENVIASKTDTRGIIVYASHAFCEISGYTQEELIGSPQNIVRHPDMPKTIFADLWSTIRSGQTWRGEVKNKKKDGGYYWVEVVIEPEFDDEGKISGYSAIRQDITDKKAVEELSENLEIKVEERTAELQEAQEQFSSMAANVPGVIYRCKVDAGWTMLYISDEIKKLSGYPVSDFINNEVRTFADIMHKEDIEPVAKLIQAQIDKGEKFLVDYRVIDKKGVVKWVRSQGQAFSSNEGEKWLDGVLYDVTEQRKLEEEIKESQKRFITLFDAAPDSIIIIKDGALIDCNQKTLAMFGVKSRRDFKKVNFNDLSPEFQDNEIKSEILAPQLISQAITKGHNQFEWKHKRLDNDELFDAEVILAPIQINGEDHIYGVVRDISERKELERLIRNNQENMTFVSQYANLGFWNFNPQVGDLYVNDVFVQMLGYNPNEVLVSGYENQMFKPFKDGLAFWEQLLHPEDAQRTGEILTAHINGETDLYKVDYRMRRADGTWMWSTAIGRIAEYDIDGKPIRFNGVNIDIDENKRAQEAIKDQKQYIDSIMNSQSNIVISTDGEKLRSANKAFFDFFEVKDVEEFLDNIGDCICDTFDTEASDEFLQKMMGEEKWIEYVYARPDMIHKAQIERHGKMHTFTITSDRFEFAGETLEVGVFTDITEMEEIRKNIEKILSNIMLPVLITSKSERKILYANEYASIQYESKIEELVGSSIDSVYTSMDQKDEILKIMAEQGYVENLEERYQTRTGKEFIGLLSVKPIVYNGEDAYIGMVVDITKQKDIEEEIRQIHKHTQSSIEYASLIQHSLIPSNDLFRSYFSDYFTIWHPKDIVGGDIYLFDELRDENECLLMVIDCTGHGVPGAFVTMLVKAIERQVSAIIAADPTMQVSPAWILKYFNQTMKKLLKQEDDEAISNAGFDGAVLYYNKQEQIVRFAGAELPLFYTEDGEFKTIKGNRHSIGYKKSDADYEFKEHLIEAKEGMQFYLTTDGYLDQNGGEKGFPFGKKRFLSILEEYKDYSFADQQEVLLNAMQEYQGEEERNDDISIVGIKIKKVDETDVKPNESWVI